MTKKFSRFRALVRFEFSPVEIFLSDFCRVRISALFSVFLLSCGLPVSAQEPATPNTLSIGSYFSKGSYGEAIDTRIRYFPLSYAYQADKWRFQITVPTLETDGLGNVLVNLGGVTRARSTGERVKSSGLGDTIASLTYHFDATTAEAPFIDLSLEVKIPSADESRGLGTGETDYTLRLDILKVYSGFTVFGAASYRKSGKTALFPELQNSAAAELGINFTVRSDIGLGAIYTYSQPASTFSHEIHEILPFISWQLNERWSVMTYGVWGFTADSPDQAVGAQLSYRF